MNQDRAASIIALCRIFTDKGIPSDALCFASAGDHNAEAGME
jgi:hypothetical protein